MSNDNMMTQATWQAQAHEVLEQAPVIPVLVLNDADSALGVAEALIRGGLSVLEITLRTPAALAVIERLRLALPEARIGAGTVTNVMQLRQAYDSGARFFISPGLTPPLLEEAVKLPMPLIPGVSTASELMTGLDHGLQHFKFFPAAAAGGTAMLKSLAGPFAHCRFCPTGGIGPDTAPDYLALPNVSCVGGSWLVTPDDIAGRHWSRIEARARAALNLRTAYPGSS